MKSSRGSLKLAAAAALALAGFPGPATGVEPLRVRASDLIAPCVSAALSADGARAAIVTEGDADVLVASSVEVTRAIESGQAIEGSEVALARVPWVLVAAKGQPLGLRGLADLANIQAEVAIPASPAAFEARRALEAVSPGRIREEKDASRLRSAPLALVPLSLAGNREPVATEVPALRVTAAVLTASKRSAQAADLLHRLQEPPAIDAFTACQPRE